MIAPPSTVSPPDPANTIKADGKILTISGRFPRIARVRAEHHDLVEDVDHFLADAKKRVPADIISFIQPVTDLKPRHPFNQDWEPLAVLQFQTYETWWKQQLNDKTRNMVRKAGKKGVVIRTTQFDEAFLNGIKTIYDETPYRQGKPFRHYRKDLDALRTAHLSFLDRSEFIGAYYEDNLIGFIKMIYHRRSASIMQIIALVSHRDKAPTNALIAKAVELCEARDIHHIQYGVWSRRTLGDFKKHNRFEMVRVPRYYVPLNWRGKLALSLGLHRNFLALVPPTWMDWALNLRGRWIARKRA